MATSASACVALNINAGGGAITAASDAPAGGPITQGGSGVGAFAADEYESGGYQSSTNSAIDLSYVAPLGPPVALWQDYRVGTSTYTITSLTPNARYRVQFDFVEPFFSAAGQRVFNIAINGATVASNQDIFARAKGENRAFVERYTATADSTGTISIVFGAVTNSPIVSGLQLLQLPTSSTDPTTCWTNADPAPTGYGLAGVANVNSTWNTDPFHIDWTQFCLHYPTECGTSTDPPYAPNDAQMVAQTIATDNLRGFFAQGVTHICTSLAVINNPSQCGGNVGVYYANETDPQVSVNVISSSYPPLNVNPIYLPYGALSDLTGDRHLSVRQPNGMDCQFWEVGSTSANPTPGGTAIPVTGPTMNVVAGACASPGLQDEGNVTLFNNGGAGYAGQDEMSRGFIRGEDMLASLTNLGAQQFSHALYITVANNLTSQTVYPAAGGGDGHCTAPPPTAQPVYPREGMYLYLDGDGYKKVMNWTPAYPYMYPFKSFLLTMHVHGLIDMDSSNYCSPTNQSTALPYMGTLVWGPQASLQAGVNLGPMDTFISTAVAPFDSMFLNAGGSDQLIYKNATGSYSYAMTHFQEVPSLTIANFHWIDLDCAKLAIKGSSGSNCQR